uniref:Protein kinase domain-containing protein n=1 Tax=Leersia perrieri TaxID=77586 RepID=A0A0D9W3W6_9ORYZ
MSPQGHQVLWLAVVWLSVAFAGAANAECPDNTMCGGVNIPYPFGIRSSGCALAPHFELDCNNSKLFLGDFEVLNISIQLSQIRVLNRISSFCYNPKSREMKNNTWVKTLSSPYRLSNSTNKFTVIGCRTLAYIADAKDERYMSGCVSSCPGGDARSAINGTCSGIGCCETAIPTGLRNYRVYFGKGFNTSASIYYATPCSYAVLTDSTFKFSTSYLTSLEFNTTDGGRAPMVLDWAIRTANNCQEAPKNLTSYACKSENSQCVISSNGPGYICSCKEGFQGNPYRQGRNGCQDINECENAENHSCYGECNNRPGGFECHCRAGSRGNASIPGGCQKDYLPPRARLAIGVVVSLLFALLVFLGWEVIRHKRNIKRQALLRMDDENFQQNGGQLLREMIRAEANITFNLYSSEQIKAATNNFDIACIVGKGGQGTVYRAVLDEVSVAIKRCNNEIDESRKMDFVQELVILCRVNHPNVVKLLGCCLQFKAPMLIYEFVQHKTLQELLDLIRSRMFHVTLGTRLRIAAESATALAHLHSLPRPILHGDVKPANILLAEGLVAKVSDFGCSTIDGKTQAVAKGTPGYMDPDYLLEYQLTAKNDVYSFGVILLELLTGKVPLSKGEKSLTLMFQEAMASDTLADILDSDIVDETRMIVIRQAAVLASQCLVVPSITRPTMTLVAAKLQQLALADEVQQYPQPPLLLEDMSCMEVRSTMSTCYGESNTSGVYNIGKKAVLSIEFAR